MTESVGVTLRRASEILDRGQTDSPGLDAEVLLAHVLGQGRAWLLSHTDDALSEEAAAAYFSLIAERAAGMPVAYLTGMREFWSMELKVSPEVLIPRPETELLVELALAALPGRGARVLDLGAGSGAISLAITRERPGIEVIGVDKSPAAIRIARENAERYGIANVTFIVSDWFSAVSARRFDLVVANPPYIDPDDAHLLGEVRFEPRDALVSGNRGLADLETIISAAESSMVPGGCLMVEHGFDQAEAVSGLFRAAGFDDVKTFSDLAGLPRVTRGVCRL